MDKSTTRQIDCICKATAWFKETYGINSEDSETPVVIYEKQTFLFKHREYVIFSPTPKKALAFVSSIRLLFQVFKGIALFYPFVVFVSAISIYMCQSGINAFFPLIIAVSPIVVAILYLRYAIDKMQKYEEVYANSTICYIVND